MANSSVSLPLRGFYNLIIFLLNMDPLQCIIFLIYTFIYYYVILEI